MRATVNPRRTRLVGLMGLVGLVAMGAALTGCQEPPSYRLRWAIDGEPLSLASQCSETGILDIRLRTIDVLGRTVDITTLRCFGQNWLNPDVTAPGPTLPPGEYAVEVRGSARNNVLWQDDAILETQVFDATLAGSDYLRDQKYDLCRPEPPPNGRAAEKIRDVTSCRPEDLVCDCTTVTVVEEAERIPVLDGFNLRAPPQCVDGLDNDGDGLVDGQDTACVGAFADAIEDTDIAQASFDIRVSFFSHNPNAVCRSIRQVTAMQSVAIELDDQLIRDTACTDGPIRFARALAVGEHSVRVSVLDGDGAPVATPFETTVSVIPRVGGSFAIAADFPLASFTAPIDSLAAFTTNFRPFDGAPLRTCSPNSAQQGRLEVDMMRVEFRSSRDEPVPAVALDDGTLLQSTALIPCANGQLLTQSLSWGEYLVRLEGLSDAGDVCFSNLAMPTPAAPAEPFSVTAQRVIPVPDSCRDCDDNFECGSYVCDAGLCVPPCEGDAECPDGELCAAGICQPE